MQNSSVDAALLPFFSCQDEAAEQQLALLVEQFQPLIKQIIWRRLSADIISRADAGYIAPDDLCNDVIVQLVSHLRELKSQAITPQISNFSAYVAVTTANICNQYIRAKRSQHWSLRNRIRYLLTRESEFSIWQSDGLWFCGLARWQQDGLPPADDSKVAQLQAQPAKYLINAVDDNIYSQQQPLLLLNRVFQWLARPIRFDALINIAAAIWGIADYQPSSLDQENSPAATLQHPQPLADELLVSRITLKDLWQEISLLLPRQRAALLLNLRDSQNRDIIMLLPETGTASITEIARVLEIPLSEFEKLWPELPLDDAAIAKLLDATPRQVIRLRKSARERLTRRWQKILKKDTE